MKGQKKSDIKFEISGEMKKVKGGKVGESVTTRYKINKKKKSENKKRNSWKQVDDVAVNMAPKEHNNNKYYVSTFIYIYIYILLLLLFYAGIKLKFQHQIRKNNKNKTKS